MKTSLWKALVCILMVLTLCGAAWLIIRARNPYSFDDRGITGPAFPRFAVDSEGVVSKDLPKLSTISLVRVPSRQLKRLIFGINPIVLEPPTSSSPDIERVTFSVENKPSDIIAEYKEYLDATAQTYYESVNTLGLVILSSSAQTTITVSPYSPSGSLVMLTRKQQP